MKFSSKDMNQIRRGHPAGINKVYKILDDALNGGSIRHAREALTLIDVLVSGKPKGPSQRTWHSRINHARRRFKDRFKHDEAKEIG